MRREDPVPCAIAALAAVLAGLGAQGCCDSMVVTDTSSVGEASSTGDEASTDSTSAGESSTSTGEPALPEWTIGVFSTESDKVGMTMDHPLWYSWGRMEVTETGALFFDWYSCSVHRERQQFRWTSTDGGQSLSLQSVPPADVFTYGAGHQVSEIVIEPGDSCDTIIVRWFHVEAMA